jgi:hypothetical protein
MEEDINTVNEAQQGLLVSVNQVSLMPLDTIDNGGLVRSAAQHTDAVTGGKLPDSQPAANKSPAPSNRDDQWRSLGRVRPTLFQYRPEVEISGFSFR